MKEIWKPVVGWENLYEVSNLGSVRSLDRYVNTNKKYQLFVKGKILRQTSNNGYMRIQLNKNGEGISYLVHRLVAEAFLNNYDINLQVNHKNGIKNDNRVENLEMVTAKENQIHSYHILKTKPSMQGRFGSNHVRSIKINQFDKQGNFIKTWNSIIEASKKLDIQPSCISNVCANRRKLAGGYIWRYASK